MNQTKDISIVIVNWNTCDILKNCLDSVYSETNNLRFEIIVVDNASSDNSVEVIKSDFPQVVLIENSENKGFATANNQGMAIAGGKYILLLNSDTVILNHAIEKTVAFSEKHPEAGIVGCRVVNQDMSLQPTCFMYPSVLNMFLSSAYLYKIFPKSKYFGQERMTWWDRNDIREVDVVTGCFMLVRYESLKQVGVMDEQFFMYCEETDWCYRFKQAGWKMLFYPYAEIIHLGGQSSKMVAIEMALQLRGSILQFIDKHQSKWKYVLACFFVWLFCAIRIPIWLIRFLFGGQNRKYNWIRLKIYTIGACRILTRGGKSLCLRSK